MQSSVVSSIILQGSESVLKVKNVLAYFLALSRDEEWTTKIEESRKRAEDSNKTFESFDRKMVKFADHYWTHLLKVVLGNHSDCEYCHGLIDAGKVIEDEGKATKGISRTVNSFGNEAYVLVPKSWLGKKVKVSLIE